MTSNNNDSSPPPLTTEQELKRAATLASLYPESSGDGRSFIRRGASMEVKQHVDSSPPIQWRKIIIATVTMSTLLVLIDIGIETLLEASRRSAGDAVVARVAMVFYILVAFLFIRVTYKKLLETLEASVISPRLIIGMSILFATPIILWARNTVAAGIDTDDNNLILAGSLVIYGVVAATLSAVTVSLFIHLTNRTRSNKAISVVPVVLIILMPYIIGLAWALYTFMLRI